MPLWWCSWWLSATWRSSSACSRSAASTPCSTSIGDSKTGSTRGREGTDEREHRSTGTRESGLPSVQRLPPVQPLSGGDQLLRPDAHRDPPQVQDQLLVADRHG